MEAYVDKIEGTEPIEPTDIVDGPVRSNVPSEPKLKIACRHRKELNETESALPSSPGQRAEPDETSDLSPPPPGVVRPWQIESVNHPRSKNESFACDMVCSPQTPHKKTETPIELRSMAGLQDHSTASLSLLNLFQGLMMEPRHREWMEGLLSWYLYETQRLQAHFYYMHCLGMSQAEQGLRVMQATMQDQLTAYTHLLLQARLHTNGELTPASKYSPDTNDTSSRSNLPSYHSNKRSLPMRAVRMMEEWYRAHVDHPYPDCNLVQYFSKVGGITTNQVKKWMANKRVRSMNTLSYNGSIHPKRLRRMMRDRKSCDRSLEF